MQQKSLSIYVHYPFCKSKCPYCDFNSHVGKTISDDVFLQGYLAEIDYFSQLISKREIKTIFFGGGTPSLMPTYYVEKILARLNQYWPLAKNCEITLEANPTSFESKKFQDFQKAGVNRLSLGIQALNDEDLKFLGRTHSASEAIKTIAEAAKIFTNFSFDLIYARPKQSLQAWQTELARAIDFGTKHLSLYQLTIEKGTKFFSDYAQKKFIMPDENLSADFYDLTNETMIDNGFKHYEISNYAKPEFECQHNLVYWQGGDYLGIGAGAHSRVFFDNEKNRQAIMMTHEPNSWLKKTQENKNGIQTITNISQQELIEELTLMALRLESGINNKISQEILQLNLAEIFDYKKLQNLENQGLIDVSNDNIKIRNEKRILSNAIITKVCEAIIL